MIIDEGARHLAISVGGYLYGTRRGVEFCRICTTPVTPPWTQCIACKELEALAHSKSMSLADLVVPLCYTDDGPQAKLLMHGYKGDQVGPEPQNELLLNVTLIALLGLLIHRSCIEQALCPITAITYVPSSKIRLNPPIERIAKLLCEHSEIPFLNVKYIPSAPSGRTYDPSRYELDIEEVDRAHVLIIDDTWTTGNHAQSVASMLKSTGSNVVSVLVVARWLRKSWSPSATFIAGDIKKLPYDPFNCPVLPNEACLHSAQP